VRPVRSTRREFLAASGKAGLASAVIASVPAKALASPPSGPPSKGELRTLRAAVARIVPAESPGDWSAADVGADAYIVRLLAAPGRIYAGGPIRTRFARFQPLSRVKRIGWNREIRTLRKLYRGGLRELDRQAGGDFALLPAPAQDAILTGLDDQADPFFAALYDHTMEGVYSPPVYGGNRDYRAWKSFE